MRLYCLFTAVTYFNVYGQSYYLITSVTIFFSRQQEQQQNNLLYSTVTDLAKFLGLSTSQSLCNAA